MGNTSPKDINETYKLNNNSLSIRYYLTLKFLSSKVDTSNKILDLGVPNNLSKILKEKGYQVEKTKILI